MENNRNLNEVIRQCKDLTAVTDEELELVNGGADFKECFNVILCDAGASKLEVIRVLKELTGLGLKEAKALVDAAPTTIEEGVSEARAIEDKSRLESVGAKVELK